MSFQQLFLALLLNFVKSSEVSILHDKSADLHYSVLANNACNALCPKKVIRPTQISDIVNAVLLSQKLKVPLSVRGGGHGYTCQGVNSKGIVIDMRYSKDYLLHKIIFIFSAETYYKWCRSLVKYKIDREQKILYADAGLTW